MSASYLNIVTAGRMIMTVDSGLLEVVEIENRIVVFGNNTFKYDSVLMHGMR